MRLFRYFNSHLDHTLRDCRLKVARISEFNDPFEGMYREVNETSFERIKEHLIKRAADPEFMERFRDQGGFQTTALAVSAFWERIETTAMQIFREGPSLRPNVDRVAMLDAHLRCICFSSEGDPLDEILLWSHYANKHFGCRVGFEFPEPPCVGTTLRPIRYQVGRAAVPMSIDAINSPEWKRAMDESLEIKSRAWSYESEHRLFVSPQICETETCADGARIEYFRLNPLWFRRIDFGTRFPVESRDAILALVRTNYPHVECYQAAYHADHYALEYERIN